MTRLTQARIETLAREALTRHGASERQAEALAAGIAAAERDGLKSHGLMYLPTYCEHLTCGKVLGLAEPSLTRPRPAVVAVVAGNGFPHAAIALGLPPLIEAARSQGVSALAIRNSYNCGALGYHTERIAQAALVGLGFTNAPASIAPWGGRKAAVGTNPWSLAVPDGQGGARFVIDQSASVVAKSEVIKRARAGEPIPPGWAFDASGETTTDAGEALKGTMAPAGGYKGFGMGLIVETMCAAVAGANRGQEMGSFMENDGLPIGNGQFFIALEPKIFSGGLFEKQIERLMASIISQPGARLPNQRRQENIKKNLKAGLTIEKTLYDKLKSYTERHV